MLSINLKRVFGLRGIKNPYSELVKLGISRPTAWNLLEKNVTTIRAKHLERICEYLNCEPNDIYEWRPDTGTANVENHPLKRLRRRDDANEFNVLLGQLPLDKIDQLKKVLSEMSAG